MSGNFQHKPWVEEVRVTVKMLLFVAEDIVFKLHWDWFHIKLETDALVYQVYQHASSLGVWAGKKCFSMFRKQKYCKRGLRQITCCVFCLFWMKIKWPTLIVNSGQAGKFTFCIAQPCSNFQSCIQCFFLGCTHLKSSGAAWVIRPLWGCRIDTDRCPSDEYALPLP